MLKFIAISFSHLFVARQKRFSNLPPFESIYLFSASVSTTQVTVNNLRALFVFFFFFLNIFEILHVPHPLFACWEQYSIVCRSLDSSLHLPSSFIVCAPVPSGRRQPEEDSQRCRLPRRRRNPRTRVCWSLIFLLGLRCCLYNQYFVFERWSFLPLILLGVVWPLNDDRMNPILSKLSDAATKLEGPNLFPPVIRARFWWTAQFWRGYVPWSLRLIHVVRFRISEITCYASSA